MAGKIRKKEKDFELLSNIAEYKFLTVEQLVALNKRSAQVIRRRLRSLAEEGLIALHERGIGHGPGRRENIVFATEKCMEKLKSLRVISNHAAYITDKTADSIYLDHDLLLNWFLIHLVQVGRDKPQLKIRHVTTSSHNLKLGSPDKPMLLERFASGDSLDQSCTMIPDGVFVITDETSEKSLLFFLEVDMGTETLQSTNQSPGDVRQKIINYQSLFLGKHYKRYEKVFNADFNGFRLLFLTNTLVRMRSLCDLVQKMSPSDFIWVADQEQMFSYGVSAEIWARGGRADKEAESILGPKFTFKCKIPKKP